jgi:hypothetical protein
LRAGDRAPDAPCAGPGARRLFDVYQGPQFTALAFGPNAIEALPKLAWPTEGAGLHRYAVHKGHSSDGAGLADPDGQLSGIYGITGDTLILIRPDGYVASVITADWTAAFTAAATAFTSPVT